MIVVALAFRNIDVSADAPVEEWPFEGVLAALERGGLGDWRRLAAAIDLDPWGPVARKVTQAIQVSHPYGVSELMQAAILQARADTEQRERAELAAEIRGLIEASGLTGAQFAARLGTSASRLSTYASGRVVPAATLLIRMRDVARRS